MKIKKYFYCFMFFNSALQYLQLYSRCTQLPHFGITPLFSFGHSILPKQEFAIAQASVFVKQKPHNQFLNFTNFYYGITDNATFIFSLPIISQCPLTSGKKTGLGNLDIHLNYVLFKDRTEDHRYRIIASGGIGPPTSTGKKITLYSLHTTTYFLGIVCDALTMQWYSYADFAALITTERDTQKIG